MAETPIEETQQTAAQDAQPQSSEQALEGGAYEIIRKRLVNLSDGLFERIGKLNTRRKEVFGALESRPLKTDRIVTQNNCEPRDIVSVGKYLIFGYNVFIGLKKETGIADVLNVYEMQDDRFEDVGISILENPQFIKDFRDLYSYYKNTRFTMFRRRESTLLMVFQVGKESSDVKVFKWHITADGVLHYDNNRSEREYTFPNQHAFEWKMTSRDNFVYGAHPHVSIEDRVFVETVGGDLTVKVENNTASGEGIYSEPVENQYQKLEDGEVYYAIVGSIILLKILPYQESQYRYIIFDEKKQKAVRVDDIALAAVLLPENDGLIFPGGYFSMTDGYKAFNIQTAGMKFLKTIQSPNGEDTLYVFYNEDTGDYILLQYNLINKAVESPIVCSGYAIYDDGKMVFFKAGQEAQKSHLIQLWQTPFVADVSLTIADDNTYLSRIGNNELVRGISELRAIYNLIRTEDIYLGLYHDIVRKVGSTLDLFYWLDNREVFEPKDVLLEVQSTANSAIDEYEKVVQIRKNTEDKLREAEQTTNALVNDLATLTFDAVDKYVKAMSQLRLRRGEIISLKDLRYVDLIRVEAIEKIVVEYYDSLSGGCVEYLLKEDALVPFVTQLDVVEARIPELKKTAEMAETEEDLNEVNANLDLLTELINTLDIADATQTANIIENISSIYSRVNQVKAQFNKHRKSLLGQETMLEFTAQFKLINQTVTNFIDQATTPDKCEDMLTRVMIQIEELEGKFSDFDEYLDKLTAKREEVYSTFNNKKIQLQEALNKKTNRLLESANRILNGIGNRIGTLKSIDEINGYFASDRMVLKIRDIVQELFNLGDSVKAEDISSRLKSRQQDGIRQLKDNLDLYVAGGDIIALGTFQFTVNRQAFGLTTVQRDGRMQFHLTGTEFFDPITAEGFQATKPFWNQDLVSETGFLYRSEYLAYKFLMQKERELAHLIADPDALHDAVREFMTPLFDEGYEKGVHDKDAETILSALSGLSTSRHIALSSHHAGLRYNFLALFAPERNQTVFAAQNPLAGTPAGVVGEWQWESGQLCQIRAAVTGVARQLLPGVLVGNRPQISAADAGFSVRSLAAARQPLPDR